MIGPNTDEKEAQRIFNENVDNFREETMESFKVLFRKQKQNAIAIKELRRIIYVLLVIVGVIVAILVIAVIARMVRGQ